MNKNIQLLIPAGGMGTRLGQNMPKALVPIDDQPLLIHTLNLFQTLDLADNVIIAAPENQISQFNKVLTKFIPTLSAQVIPGGEERQDSVRLGLAALNPTTDIVIIHDAARPFPPIDAIQQSIHVADKMGAATLALPCSDTILQSDNNKLLLNTPDRSTLWACQTPQVFKKEIIIAAHEAAHSQSFSCTDDASLVKWHNHPVTLVPGSATNIKITTPEDLLFAEFLLKESNA